MSSNVDLRGPLCRLLQKLNPTQTQTPNLNRITIQILETEKYQNKETEKTKIKKEKNIQNSTTSSTRTGTSWIRLFGIFSLIRCLHQTV